MLQCYNHPTSIWNILPTAAAAFSSATTTSAIPTAGAGSSFTCTISTISDATSSTAAATSSTFDATSSMPEATVSANQGQRDVNKFEAGFVLWNLTTSQLQLWTGTKWVNIY